MPLLEALNEAEPFEWTGNMIDSPCIDCCNVDAQYSLTIELLTCIVF